MEEESDFLKLSIEERCQHKLWKARVSGYEDAAKLFNQQDDDKSPEFNKYLGLLKKFVIDSNAVAQEKGLVAVLAFVENAACAPRVVNDIMSGLVSKCFSSPRAKTRELALEIALMYIEIEKQEAVLEELIKGLENKSPKVVSNCIVALREALHLFGSQVISLKPLVKVLPKLLEDRDKSVREESKQLCVEIYRWVGDALKTQLQSLKPVTLSELENEFQKTVGERVVPSRYLKSQQEKIAKAKENDTGEAEATEEAFVPPAVVDPYDLMTAVDVLSKLPKNFYEQCEAKKWQERKEVLETLLQLTTNVKLEPGDYGDLVRVLKKFITKDSNVVVVGLAVKCLSNLIQGLRKKFQPYASAMIPAIFEKFKEKKQNVVVPLRETIDGLYNICGFEAMLEDIQSALDNKNPQIKAETCAFLSRAFATCTAAQLNKKLLKAFTVSLLKTLNDTDGTVRENAAEALGTALKVVGDRVMSNFLQEVDSIKMAKIKDFCDKAEVKQPVTIEKKPTSAPAVIRPAPVKQEDPVPEPVKSEPAKQTTTGIKKPTSAVHAKSKGSGQAARSVRSGGAKRGQIDVGEPEFKENELSEEDVLTQTSEIFTADVINGLGSSNWKDRLAACEKFFETTQAMEKGSLPAQCLVKLLAKKPGFKENNFQILKLRFEILAYIAENAQISHVTVECCLSDVVDKIGDAKSGVHAGLALTALASATTLDYISLEVLNLAFNQKNPKNQSEALMWVSNAIKQFGLKVQVKEIIDNLKKGFSSTNPGVRNAALALVGTMYMYVGKSLRSFFEDEKPALLQQIDSEFEKMKDSKPPPPVKGKAAKVDGSGDATEGSGQVNLADLMPTVDISSQITSQLLSDLSDKDWHLRSDALQKISVIISDAKFISPNLGELPLALKPRLADTNKRLALQALNLCQMLGTSLGSQCSKQIRNFAPGILTCLGDNKANVRAAAVQCLNSWMDNCSLVSLFEGEVVYDALRIDNPLLRIELFSWLTEKLPTVTSLPSAELALCVPILLNCIEDRNPDVRKKAADCLLPFMIHVGYETMARAASKMKPASKATVVDQLNKVRQNLPAKATTTKSKPNKSAAPPAERSSPPQATSNDEGGKGKLNRSTSKSKLALKTPASSTSKAKKEEEIDTSPSLVANNMKDQRMADEKGLKVLKWNFTTPREEFYVQLRDQMTAANWSKTLISHCFHNDFKFHIKAIDLLIESLSNGVEASAANLDLILKWLALRFFDTNPSVLIKSLEYLQVLFQALMGINYHMLDLEAASFVPYLILKIGDPKDAVRKGVREIIKSISRIYPYSKMFSYIMQGLPSKNARQRAECLEELGSMIESYGLNVCQPSPAVALKEIAKQISDRDNSVRNAALNCVVQAYFIEGEKVYKFVGQLSDKDLSLLEERIKRSSKPKISKPVESNIPSAKVSPPAAHFNTSYSAAVEEPKALQNATSASRSGRLRLDTDDIEQMFKHKEPQAQLPGLIQVNADDILNLPDIQLPRTRMRPPATSLKILNSADDVDTAVNLVMAQLAAQEIPVVMQAFAQIEEVLKSDQAVRVLQSRVDQLLVFGALQYRYAHNKHMADENICKADVVSLYRCVTMALASLFDNPALAKKASRDVIRDLIPHLITVMLDNRLDDLQDGALVVKVINVLIMRILQKANPTHVLSALIKLLHDCIGNLNVSERFTDLIMKCLWKMIRMIRLIINDLNIDRILLDIHVFLKTFPSSSWKERPNDTPIRTIKTTLYKLVEIKGEDIMKHLSLISDRQESDLVNYLHKLLARIKEDNRKSSNKNSLPDDNSSGNNRHKRCKSSPLKLSKSTHEALTEIFRKIGCKEQTKEGLAELYEFTQNHPEADIEPYLKTSSDFFQNYIRQGIQQLEKEKCSNKSKDTSNRRGEESGEWNSNLSGKDISFSKEKNSSHSWEDKFPPVPPCTVDTTPMDLVEWLKNVVARLGMDTSKYDDPSFLEKINGNGNEGPLSEEEVSQMFSDIERYRKMIEDLKNAV
ncbi:cytoskeleton-associated protein 5-like isoform X1 [Argiope bruennichi]|uniref:cytoskeleton-associated protein 5-like isoform X1 n=1 Tax=Argiope bruennichi TaxID=94029 RepID=UPI002493E93D|nr:cytoskeleton-associated protein 5-like isoform X1 [Argiope bruennichi]